VDFFGSYYPEPDRLTLKVCEQASSARLVRLFTAYPNAAGRKLAKKLTNRHFGRVGAV